VSTGETDPRKSGETVEILPHWINSHCCKPWSSICTSFAGVLANREDSSSVFDVWRWVTAAGSGQLKTCERVSTADLQQGH